MKTNGSATADVRGELERLSVQAAADDIVIDMRPLDDGKPVVHVMMNDAATGRRWLDWWPGTGVTMDRDKNRGRADTPRHALRKAVAYKEGTQPLSDRHAESAPTVKGTGDQLVGRREPVAAAKPPQPLLPLSLKDRRKLAAALLERAVGGDLGAARLLLENAGGRDVQT